MPVDEDRIVKKMVAEIADSNEKFMGHQSQDMENFKRIVPVLLEKGIDNVNLSMFDEATKSKLLNALGEEYIRRGNMNDSVKAFILAGNRQRLVEVGEHYEEVGLFTNAIDTYRLADSNDRLLIIGKKCLENGHFADAIKSFRLCNDVESLADRKSTRL